MRKTPLKLSKEDKHSLHRYSSHVLFPCQMSYLVVFANISWIFLHIQEEEQRLSELVQQKKQGLSLGTIAGRFFSRKQQWGLVLLTPTLNSPTSTVTRHWDEGHSQKGGRWMWAGGENGSRRTCVEKPPIGYTEGMLPCYRGWDRSERLQKTFHSCGR